jgi:hypothetical protein
MTPRCEKVLRALESAPMGIAAIYLHEPHLGGLDYRKRVSELRKMGYKIESYPIKNRPYHRYVLEGRTA